MKAKHWLLPVGAILLAASLTTSASTQNVPDSFAKDAAGKNTGKAKSAGATGAKTKRAIRPAKFDPVEGKWLTTYSLAERTAMNRQDCLPNNLHKDGLGIHGAYRTYGQWDPQLKSIEGRRQYEACVKRGLEPTPWFAFGQRMMIASTGSWWGDTKERCLMCHSKY